MSKELLLRFGTRNIDKARKLAGDIAKRMKDATKEGSKARALVDGIGSANKKLLDRTRGSALGKRGAAIRRGAIDGQRVANQVEDIAGKAQVAGSRGLAGLSAAKGLLTSGNPFAGLTFLSGFSAVAGPAGIAIQAATMAVELLRPMIEKEAERQRIQMERAVFIEMDRRLAELDVAKRLQNDPVFAAERAADFSQELVNRRRAIDQGQVWLREPSGLGDL